MLKNQIVAGGNCPLSSFERRDVAIDIAKAFGILLMIIGHWAAIW